GESLLGVAIGDPQKEVRDRLRLVHSHTGDPWKGRQTRELFGQILQFADLGLPDDARAELETHWSADEKVVVIFHDGKARAVVVQEPHRIETGHGVIKDLNTMMDRYPDGRWVQAGGRDVRRCDAHGIAFEVHGHAIKACALYPPVKRTPEGR